LNINILEKFKSTFGNPHIFVKSPGRANIIGEHTDYNNGLVLPFAIDQSISMYLAPNNKKVLRMIAMDIDDQDEVDISSLSYQKNGWQRYFNNSLVAINRTIDSGIDIVFGGNLPQGGGISSSSALTCGFLAGINELFNFGFTQDELIDLASQAENGIGLNGGIMDQTAIIKGKKDHALLIDFNDCSLQYTNIPDSDYHFYLFNSGQKHNLVDTEYNKRRHTCELALKKIRSVDERVETMRDINHYHIDHLLDGQVMKKRCLHVLEENIRVIEASKAISNNNFMQLGSLIQQSHVSLSQNYEVSTTEIDFLVDISQKLPNVKGSRIMGGGFGGCTINLVEGLLDNSQIQKLQEEYLAKTGYSLSAFKVDPSDGVKIKRL